jgi:hypothetical protein
VAYACIIPRYLGDRDQENHGSKPVLANNSKNPSQKRAGGVAQGIGTEFKPQYCKK